MNEPVITSSKDFQQAPSTLALIVKGTLASNKPLSPRRTRIDGKADGFLQGVVAGYPQENSIECKYCELMQSHIRPSTLNNSVSQPLKVQRILPF